MTFWHSLFNLFYPKDSRKQLYLIYLNLKKKL